MHDYWLDIVCPSLHGLVRFCYFRMCIKIGILFPVYSSIIYGLVWEIDIIRELVSLIDSIQLL